MAAYPTEKQSSTRPAKTNMPGTPTPLPRAKASGTVPTTAASGAAAAITSSTIFGVLRVPRSAVCGAALPLPGEADAAMVISGVLGRSSSHGGCEWAAGGGGEQRDQEATGTVPERTGSLTSYRNFDTSRYESTKPTSW